MPVHINVPCANVFTFNFPEVSEIAGAQSDKKNGEGMLGVVERKGTGRNVAVYTSLARCSRSNSTSSTPDGRRFWPTAVAAE